MGRTARSILAAAVTSLVWVAACGSRTGLLVELTPPDASEPVDTGAEAEPPIDATGEMNEAGQDVTVDVIDAADVTVDVHPMCTPRTCKELGYDCGSNGDGCGGLLQCGTCTPPEICGAGGFSKCGGGVGLGPDGGPLCTPKNCQMLGFNCGPAGDGCGGALNCGSCQAPLTCGGAGTPGRCGGGCTGLCLKQVVCDSGTTTVSGKVIAGTLPQFGQPDPVSNALVYVPNAPVKPFAPGVACNQCGTDVSGEPLVATNTAADGTFTLKNMPVGANIPLVIQLGRWRRQVTIPGVTACTNTPLPQTLTRLPRNRTEGDIPRTAIATGSADAIECVLMKVGVDAAEFTQPGAGGRVELYVSNGANAGPGTPPASQLWSIPATLAEYDQVLLPCEGMPLAKMASDQQNLVKYSDLGGRIFTTHYGYEWLYDAAPFSGTAQWQVNTGAGQLHQTALVDVSLPAGQTFAAWLGNVGALTGPDRMQLSNTREDVVSVNAPSEQFLYATAPTRQTLQYDFYTPVGQPQNQQCGRVVYSDFHVDNQRLTTAIRFPNECTAGPMSAQEKALEYQLFNLASCVPAGGGPCVPRTCADQGLDCGPAGDGCGNPLQCGNCKAPDTCGGGGVYGNCGYPDAGSCVPKTCAQLGYDCGVNGDGCGHAIYCGACTAPQICGGGGSPSVCGI